MDKNSDIKSKILLSLFLKYKILKENEDLKKIVVFEDIITNFVNKKVIKEDDLNENYKTKIGYEAECYEAEISDGITVERIERHILRLRASLALVVYFFVHSLRSCSPVVAICTTLFAQPRLSAYKGVS